MDNSGCFAYLAWVCMVLLYFIGIFVGFGIHWIIGVTAIFVAPLAVLLGLFGWML